MFELKRLSPSAIPQALAKAERYRLLNESWEAESICLDVLAVDPSHEEATVMLILAISDQFALRGAEAVERARALLPAIKDDYQKAYYEGLIYERRAKAVLDAGRAGSGGAVYEWLRDAMECFERAAANRPKENDEAILRWNTCVRMLERHAHVRPREDREEIEMLE